MPPEEWPRVPVPVNGLTAYSAPENIALVVVESDEGEILAACAVLSITHFEGLWIKPEERGNAGVFRSLLRMGYALPQCRGEKWALGGAEDGDERMKGLCHKLGGKELPLKLFAIPVGG